jgi:hypothetical protein
MTVLSGRTGRSKRWAELLLGLGLALAACSGDDTSNTPRDAGSRADAATGGSNPGGRAGAGAGGSAAGAGAGGSAAGAGAGGSAASAGTRGSGGADAARETSPDAPPDGAAGQMGSGGGTADAGGRDAVSADVAPDTSNGALTGGPCRSGAVGRTAWRFGYSSGSTSSTLLEYGMPDRSNWEANPVFSTSFVDAGNGGGLELAGSNWILIRYSVVGLTAITRATLSIYGRSYATASSGSFEGWTPIHGTSVGVQNSVSNAWPYRWYSIDFTGRVLPGDDPGLTGIRLYARGGSNSLVINQVELCIEGR